MEYNTPIAVLQRCLSLFLDGPFRFRIAIKGSYIHFTHLLFQRAEDFRGRGVPDEFTQYDLDARAS
jgi:hypothetical protein